MKQQGKERAEYGKALIRDLSERLTLEFGSGFGVLNLAYFRQFYLSFPIFHSLRGISPEGKIAIERQQAIRYAPRSELTWTHYRTLMRVDKQEAREWYMKEAADQNWSTRALNRYDALCIEPVPAYSPEQIRTLRDRYRISQAAILNTSLSTIQKWEIGEKHPGGPSLKLLNILDRKGIEALV